MNKPKSQLEFTSNSLTFAHVRDTNGLLICPRTNLCPHPLNLRFEGTEQLDKLISELIAHREELNTIKLFYTTIQNIITYPDDELLAMFKIPFDCLNDKTSILIRKKLRDIILSLPPLNTYPNILVILKVIENNKCVSSNEEVDQLINTKIKSLLTTTSNHE